VIASRLQALWGWFDARMPSVAEQWKIHASEYYAPKNFNFWYFFGSLALLVLVIQIVSGIFLTMNYKPDATLAFGSVAHSGNECSFIGLPGNPVSSFVTFLIFVRPFLLRLQGIAAVAPRAIQARADFDWPEPDARREFLRVKWNAQGGLDLYPTQDSAVLTSTAWADGLVDNPAAQAIKEGDVVRFLPYSELYW